jgi:hypothetical protein
MMTTYHESLPASTVQALKLLKAVQRRASLLFGLALLIPAVCLMSSIVTELTAPFHANVEVTRALTAGR